VPAQPRGQQQPRRAEADDPEQRDDRRRDAQRLAEAAATLDARVRREPQRDRRRAGQAEPGQPATVTLDQRL